MAESKHSIRFPGESGAYRAARDKLLESEIELRRKIEAVAAQRRELPLGGKIEQDYVFDQTSGGVTGQVRLSELFAPGKDSLIIYSFMYGPAMPEPCFACTSILDGLDGESPHVNQRVNFYVAAKSPLDRILAFTGPRGWRNLRLLSSAHNTYNHDYHAETEKGDQLPALNVFVKRDGAIHHFYNTELFYVPHEPGQDARHVDQIWPIWNLFDLIPEGRGEKWHPQLRY